MTKKTTYILLLLITPLITIFAYKHFSSPKIWPSPTFPHYTDFEKSMSDRKLIFGIHSADDKQWLAFFKELYEKNHPANVREHTNPLIPKKIHQIWLGGEPPQYVYALQKSWQALHPGWEYKLWRDDDVKNMKIHNKELFDAALNYGQKADILRYHILFEIGGVYADCDFKCLQPLDMLHHRYTFYTGLNNCGNVELANGLIGASPKHPVIKQCLDSLQASKEEFLEKSQNDPDFMANAFSFIIGKTGPAFFTRCFIEAAPKCKDPIIALPCSFFYPLPNTHRNTTLAQSNKFIQPESFAIHYWACSWMRPEAFIKPQA